MCSNVAMVSASLLKIIICQKSSMSFFHRGLSALFPRKPFLCKPLVPHSSVRFLCTRDSNFSSGRWTDRKHDGRTKNTNRHKGQEWDDAVHGARMRNSSPRSVFAAGTAKRTAEWQRRNSPLALGDKEEQWDQSADRSRKAGEMQPPDRPLSVAEWRNVKENLGNSQRFEIQMMCAMFTSCTQLDVAKSLLTFVAMETGTLSYELLLRYLAVCVSGGHDAEVSEVYDIMRGSFASLDTGASTLFIKSFSRTERWREALHILSEVKRVLTPSARNYGDIIAGAVEHGDAATGWALYEELIGKGLSPHEETWDALFKRRSISQPDDQDKLLQILLYMRDNQIYPGHSLASTIKTWFESLPGETWTGSWTRATTKGTCGCCKSELESIQLTAAEYQQLKDRVMTDILQGRDVFTKTTPKELESFRSFVKRKPAFDVVVDGLNVANINQDKSRQSKTLLAVVSELQHQGLTVLVLGRRHMLQPSRSWVRHDMNLVQQKAHCFFTENISEDDPFLLYATLFSGNHCRFVSRDLMRDHKACLTDAATRRLFFKWQRGHQMVLDGSVSAARGIRFLSVPSYDTIVQSSEDAWHIPYDDTEDRSTYEVPQRWLCLTKRGEMAAHS
ncbi:mitochondrial ribonuclease P catalytic subunit isoform X1 [Takifugu rubripes]|uniref:mitochondrial ribonuclease P catalytic subunit isoform X1 n=2 Tax=Takifugu rubripes TaxID=31033 RepID=UPI0011454061|nr:mitochondrial ribonuclease P catalytic subunit isoform X1 [Takifugu rubripes]